MSYCGYNNALSNNSEEFLEELGIYLSDAEVIYFSDSRPVTPVS
jgi:hypothetical protein